MLVKRDIAAVAAAGLLGLVAVGTAPTTAAAAAPATATTAPAAVPVEASQSVAWAACPQPEAAQYGAQCGTLTVPMDWSDQSGPTIGLAVMRVPASGASTGAVIADSED